MKRYFIVFYTFKSKNPCGHGVGEASIDTTDGRYLNKSKVVSELKRDAGFEEVLVSNIIELSESDFDDWRK